MNVGCTRPSNKTCLPDVFIPLSTGRKHFLCYISHSSCFMNISFMKGITLFPVSIFFFIFLSRIDFLSQVLWRCIWPDLCRCSQSQLKSIGVKNVKKIHLSRVKWRCIYWKWNENASVKRKMNLGGFIEDVFVKGEVMFNLTHKDQVRGQWCHECHEDGLWPTL